MVPVCMNSFFFLLPIKDHTISWQGCCSHRWNRWSRNIISKTCSISIKRMMIHNQAHNINGLADADGLALTNPTNLRSLFNSLIYRVLVAEDFGTHIIIIFAFLGVIKYHRRRWGRSFSAATLLTVFSYILWMAAKSFTSFEAMKLSVIFFALAILMSIYVLVCGQLNARGYYAPKALIPSFTFGWFDGGGGDNEKRVGKMFGGCSFFCSGIPLPFARGKT